MSDLYRERLQEIIDYASVEDKANRPMFRAQSNKKDNNKKNNNDNDSDKKKNNNDNEDEDEDKKKDKSLADELMELVSEGVGNYEQISTDYAKNLRRKMTSEMNFDYQNTRIFGMPHQFLPTADMRIDMNHAFGYCFAKDIFMERPIVTLMPGTTNFLPDMSKSDKKAFASLMGDVNSGNNKEILQSILSSFDADDGQRYYDFKADYPTYIRYVNLLCRTCAVYLGIGNTIGPDGKHRYKYYDWGNYMPYQKYTVPSEIGDKNIFSLTDTLANLYNKLMTLKSDVFIGYRQYTHFYVDPSTSISENISNTAQKSQLEGMFDTAESVVKEANMILNSISDATSYIQNFLESFTTKLMDVANSVTFGFFNNILGNSGQEVLHGANLIYPEIWIDSEYSKDYTIVIDLVSPYGSDEAIYLNIIVPMMHLLAYAIPRQSTANSYVSPFLVKAFLKGSFSCEMGIVSSISFDKGPDNSWSVNGLPTHVKVTMNVHDLYSKLMMTPAHKPSLFFANQGMIDYLGSLCGLDLTVPNITTKMETVKALLGDYTPSNMMGKLYRNMTASLNDKIRNLTNI